VKVKESKGRTSLAQYVQYPSSHALPRDSEGMYAKSYVDSKIRT